MFFHHRLHTLQFDQQSITYLDQGQSNSSILFLHGMGCDHQTWHRNINNLQNFYRCVALDLPGYGKSIRTDKKCTLEYYMEMILRMVEHLNSGPFHVIGHSMGAQLAVKLSVEYPSLFKSLVLIAPAGLEKFTLAEKTFLLNLYQPDLLRHLPMQEYLNNLKKNFYRKEDIDHDLLDNFIRIFRSNQFPEYCKTLSENLKSMLEQPIFDHLHRITQPVMFIFGRQDQLIPNRILHPHLSLAEIAQVGYNMIPESQLQLLDNAGHFVHWEQASTVNQSIIQFLK